MRGLLYGSMVKFGPIMIGVYPFRFALGITALCLSGIAAQAQDPAAQLEEVKLLKVKALIDKGIRGNLYVNCDDVFILYVNGTKVMEGKWPATPEPRAFKFKPGDLLVARAGNISGPFGFSMIFRSNSRKASFSTGTNDWYTFAPKSQKTWWETGPFDRLDKQPCSATAVPFKVAIEEQSEMICKTAIWGDLRQSTVYLVKQVTYDDLMEK